MTNEFHRWRRFTPAPLVYMENKRTIPAKWRDAFLAEMNQTHNVAYAENVKRTMEKYGARFK